MAKTFHGQIEDTLDALIILEACRQGVLPRINRRLLAAERGEPLTNMTDCGGVLPNDSESSSSSSCSQPANDSPQLSYAVDFKEEMPNLSLITPGSVFVFDEKESGICRWTDGRIWSPSRICGNFLVYRELFRKLTNEKCLNSNDKAKMKNGSGLKDKALKEKVVKDNLVVLGCMKGTFVLKKDGLIKKTICVRGLDVLSPEELRKLSNQGNRGHFARRGKNPQSPIFKMGDMQHLVCYERSGAMENLHRPKDYLELFELPLSRTFIMKQKYRNPVYILPLAPGEEPIDPYDEYIRNSRVSESRPTGKDEIPNYKEQPIVTSGTQRISDRQAGYKKSPKRDHRSTVVVKNLSLKSEVSHKRSAMIDSNINPEGENASNGYCSSSGSEYKECIDQPVYSTELIKKIGHPYSTRGRAKVLECQEQRLEFSTHDQSDLRSNGMTKNSMFRSRVSSSPRDTKSMTEMNTEQDPMFQDSSSRVAESSISFLGRENKSIWSYRSHCEEIQGPTYSVRDHLFSVHGIKRNGEWRLCTATDHAMAKASNFTSRPRNHAQDFHRARDSSLYARDYEPTPDFEESLVSTKTVSEDIKRQITTPLVRKGSGSFNTSGNDGPVFELCQRSDDITGSDILVKSEPVSHSPSSSSVQEFWSGSSLSSGRSLSSSLSLSPQNSAKTHIEPPLISDQDLNHSISQTLKSTKYKSMHEQIQIELEVLPVCQSIKLENSSTEGRGEILSQIHQSISSSMTMDNYITTESPIQSSMFQMRAQCGLGTHEDIALPSYVATKVPAIIDDLLSLPEIQVEPPRLPLFADNAHRTQSASSSLTDFRVPTNCNHDRQSPRNQQENRIDNICREPIQNVLIGDQFEYYQSFFLNDGNTTETPRNSMRHESHIPENLVILLSFGGLSSLRCYTNLTSSKGTSNSRHENYDIFMSTPDITGSNVNEHTLNTQNTIQQNTEQSIDHEACLGFREYTSNECLVETNDDPLELKKWSLSASHVFQNEKCERTRRSDESCNWPSVSSNVQTSNPKGVNTHSVSNTCATSRSDSSCSEKLSLYSNTSNCHKSQVESSAMIRNYRLQRALGQRVQYKSPSSYLFPRNDIGSSDEMNHRRSANIIDEERIIPSNSYIQDNRSIQMDTMKTLPLCHTLKSSLPANTESSPIAKPILDAFIPPAAYHLIDRDIADSKSDSIVENDVDQFEYDPMENLTFQFDLGRGLAADSNHGPRPRTIDSSSSFGKTVDLGKDEYILHRQYSNHTVFSQPLVCEGKEHDAPYSNQLFHEEPPSTICDQMNSSQDVLICLSHNQPNSRTCYEDSSSSDPHQLCEFQEYQIFEDDRED